MNHETRRVVAVSPEQERLWFLSYLSPSIPVFNTGRTLTLRGKVNLTRCQQVLSLIAKRHEALRTLFTLRDSKLTGIVYPSIPIELEYTDLSDDHESHEKTLQIAHDCTNQAFTLDHHPLWRAHLVRVAPTEWRLIYVAHRMILDVPSIATLDREIERGLAASDPERALSLPPRTTPSEHTAAWLAQWSSGCFERQLSYWRQTLRGAPEDSGLPTDRPRPARRAPWAGTHVFSLGPELSLGIESLADQGGTDSFTVLLTGLIALLRRYANRTDIAVGTLTAPRSGSPTDDSIGPFVGTLVLRIDLGDDPTFRDATRRVHYRLREEVLHQGLPLASVIDAVVPDRDPSRPPLCQISVSEIPPTSSEAVPSRTTHLDLEIEIETFPPDGTRVRIQYAVDLFDSETIRHLAMAYRELLTSAAESQTTTISALRIIPLEGQKLLDSWSGPSRGYPEWTLHEAVFEQADLSRNAPAVGCCGHWMSYRELAAQACQIARWLRLAGVESGTVVAVCLPRGSHLLPTLLGILTAGGAYLPLESTHQPDQLATMLTDAGVRYMVTTSDLASTLCPPAKVTVLCLDSSGKAIKAQKQTRPVVEVTPDDTAYVMFTSTATGHPVGIRISHRSVLNRLLWMCDQFGLDNSDRVLHKAPYTLDISVWELFWPLLSGAGVVIAAPGAHRDTEYLAGLINRERVTVAHFVPSLFEAFLEYPVLLGLDRVICSGEDLTPQLVMRCFERLPGIRLYNFYGPTEATIDVAWHTCVPGEPRVPIGRPVANTRVEILDESLRRLPIGAVGELCVAGVQVASGYLNQPEMTTRHFVPDPFGPPGRVLYRTGDLARWRHDGEIILLGRADDQVRVKGMRVEFSEIRMALESHLNVDRAIVTCREDASHGPALVAYVRWTGAADSLSDALRNHARARLPRSMIPSSFVNMSSFPVLPNGKLDMASLPAPAQAPITIPQRLAPRTPTELMLCGIWCELLGLPEIGVMEDFFDLGGDSLLALGLIDRINRAFRVVLPLDRCFDLRTIADYALAILDLQLQCPIREPNRLISSLYRKDPSSWQ